MLATFQFTLQGTPFVFQGEEIGMTNTSFEDPDRIRDVEAKNFTEMSLDDWADDYEEDVRPILEDMSRDNARTPMQWDDTEHAGFTDGEPWIHVTDNYDEVNVEAARADEDSIWHYYRELMDLREERDVFVYGDYELIDPEHGEVFGYRRRLGEEELIVVCNFFDGHPHIHIGDLADNAELVVSNYDVDEIPEDRVLELRPYEARVYQQ